MSSVPNIYANLTPGASQVKLSPLQLAAATFLASGSTPPLFINQDFLLTMRTFNDSGWLNPLDYDPRTGIAKQPDIIRNVTGVSYVSRGDDIFLFRRAQDCGPEENRYEEVYIGKRADVASGTFAYYGKKVVIAGSVSDGAGGFDGRGGDYVSPDTGLSPAGLSTPDTGDTGGTWC